MLNFLFNLFMATVTYCLAFWAAYMTFRKRLDVVHQKCLEHDYELQSISIKLMNQGDIELIKRIEALESKKEIKND